MSEDVTAEKPNPDEIYPVRDCNQVTYIKPTVKNTNIIVGEFSYFSDVDFESHVIHHYPWYGDKLIIGKFCQIAAGVRFIMNGANHQMNSASTYPFYIFNGWGQEVPQMSEFPYKGDTVIGNDVWIGQDATILPGVKIGDGAIIGTQSVVGSDVEPFAIVAGNPARQIRKRFDQELIELLLELRWWDLDIMQIKEIIPILYNSNLQLVKKQILKLLKR